MKIKNWNSYDVYDSVQREDMRLSEVNHRRRPPTDWSRSCHNCRYREVTIGAYPCNDCRLVEGVFIKWEPEDDANQALDELVQESERLGLYDEDLYESRVAENIDRLKHIHWVLGCVIEEIENEGD